MSNVALVIIYNHQYVKNIAVLEDLYKDRFSHIYHLVPFYNGDLPNVIPVYENSYLFQGYVAQGYKSFYNKEYAHYFFVADDLLLNPVINESNYAEHFKLGPHTCFLPEFISLHTRQEWWKRTGEAYRYQLTLPGLEVKGQLPDYNTALDIFKKYGLELKPIGFDMIWKKPSSLAAWRKKISGGGNYLRRYLKNKLTGKKYDLPYPIVGSYSDTFIVSADAMKQFCHYCGVFAATKLFVEVSLPTAMVLAAKEIVTEKDLTLQGRALWSAEDVSILDKYDRDLSRLMGDFPAGYLYLHPIKLSTWKKKK